jgi:hypothetical protein
MRIDEQDVIFTDFEDASSSYDSEGRMLTREQSRYFANSKCVTDSKNLLVVYHASHAEFDTFDTGRVGSGGGSIFGKGFYFCDDNFGLDIYGNHIREFYLNLKNPFRWEVQEEDADATYNLDMFIEVLEQNNFTVSDDLYEKLETSLLEEDGGLDTIIELTCGADSVQTYFIRAGYDGIMNLDVGDYVAFDPEQIKLCSNKTPNATANIAA